MTKKFVLVSDIHANADALAQVVEAEGSSPEYVVAGDIIGLHDTPAETVSLVQEVGDCVIGGNHDYAVFHKGEGSVNSPELSKFELSQMSHLSDEQVEWMKSLPYFTEISLNSLSICVTHAMPWPEESKGYCSGNAGVSPHNVVEVAAQVSDEYDMVFCGHSHEQFAQDCSKFGQDIHFINGGCLGYDGTYATVDCETGQIELKSVEQPDKPQVVQDHNPYM